jgi:hypothetical protein
MNLRAPKPGVAGSNPAGGTQKLKALACHNDAARPIYPDSWCQISLHEGTTWNGCSNPFDADGTKDATAAMENRSPVQDRLSRRPGLWTCDRRIHTRGMLTALRTRLRT